MGITAQQILQSDPEYLRRELAAQEQQRFNPQGTAAGALGMLIGGGLANISQGRGFFEAPDYGLQRVSAVQSIMRSVQFDPNNPAEYYSQVGAELQRQGFSDLAPMAFQEARKMQIQDIELGSKRTKAVRDAEKAAQENIKFYKENPDQAEFRIAELAQTLSTDPTNAAALKEYTEIARAASEGAIEATGKAEKEKIEVESSKVNLQKARQDLQKANTSAQAAIDFFTAYGLDPTKGLDDQPNFKKIPASIRASAGFMPALFDAQQKALTLLKPTATPRGATAAPLRANDPLGIRNIVAP